MATYDACMETIALRALEYLPSLDWPRGEWELRGDLLNYFARLLESPPRAGFLFV